MAKMKPKNPAVTPTPEPWQSLLVQSLIQETRGCKDKARGAMSSKLIWKHLRAKMRQKQNKHLNHILAEFGDLGSIASINEGRVRHQRNLTGTEPSKPDFTATLSAIFLLTRIHCQMLGLVLVPHHLLVVNNLPWQGCKWQCSKCGVVVVQTEMVWC